VEEEEEEKPDINLDVLLAKVDMIPLSEKILTVLLISDIMEENTDGSLDTLTISKKVIGPNGTQKDVNPTLYQLEREKRIVRIKIQNKARPHWKIGNS
jgi:hypothetical protein